MSTSWSGVEQSLHDGAIALMQVVSDAGGIPTITSTIRTYREQKYLWDAYQSALAAGRPSLPAAPPYHSAHEYGWAFDMVVEPKSWQFDVGKVWTGWGGAYGGRGDPVHFELPGAGAAAWALGDTQPQGPQEPIKGGPFYALADFLSGFIPVVGTVQLVDSLVSMFDGNQDIATFYLHHPAEAIRDLVGAI